MVRLFGEIYPQLWDCVIIEKMGILVPAILHPMKKAKRERLKMKDYILEIKQNFVSSFNKLWPNVKGDRAIAIITAFRSEFTLKENRRRIQCLKARIKNKGYGFFNVDGFYLENYKKPDAKVEKEEAVFAVGRKDNSLRHDLLELGQLYDQDGFLFKPYNSNVALIFGTSPDVLPGLGIGEVAGPWQTDKLDEYYSKLRSRPFIFAFARAEMSMMAKGYYSRLKIV